jgi:hypothetical protein
MTRSWPHRVHRIEPGAQEETHSQLPVSGRQATSAVTLWQVMHSATLDRWQQVAQIGPSAVRA